MYFENKPTDELIRIAKAGLGFTVNSNKISTEALYQIITAARVSGAQITIINTLARQPEETILILEKQ